MASPDLQGHPNREKLYLRFRAQDNRMPLCEVLDPSGEVLGSVPYSKLEVVSCAGGPPTVQVTTIAETVDVDTIQLPPMHASAALRSVEDSMETLRKSIDESVKRGNATMGRLARSLGSRD